MLHQANSVRSWYGFCFYLGEDVLIWVVLDPHGGAILQERATYASHHLGHRRHINGHQLSARGGLGTGICDRRASRTPGGHPPADR